MKTMHTVQTCSALEVYARFYAGCRPDTPLEQSMLLEIDVASFTRNEDAQDEVPLAHQGKFMGLLDRQGGLHIVLHQE